MDKRKLTDSQWVSRRLRAARALLDLGREDLAAGAGLEVDVIVRAEEGEDLPDPSQWAKILTFIRSEGVRPTEFGVEFDPSLIEPPERARQLWSHKVMKDPMFPNA